MTHQLHSTSKRIAETLEVLAYVQSGQPTTHDDVQALRGEAELLVASRRRIDRRTVHDKARRQLGLSSTGELDRLVSGWLLDGSTSLQRIMETRVSSRSRQGDLQAIAAFFAASNGKNTAPEIRDVESYVAERAGRPARGQGSGLSPAVRKAVEVFAMELATDYYTDYGWSVEDVSSWESYDLKCSRPGEEELHVEVKGTTSDGTSVLLTALEVQHAHNHYPHVALFIAYNLVCSAKADGRVAVEFGDVRALEPWELLDGDLCPLAFRYQVPASHQSPIQRTPAAAKEANYGQTP